MNTIQQQGARVNAGRVYGAMKLPRFRSGLEGPQISSARSMNRIVDTLNAFLRMSISQGTSDAVLISDSGVVIQKVPDVRDFAVLRASSGIPDANAYWRFDEAGSVTRVDHVLGLAVGVLSGSVPNASGIINQAAKFSAGPRSQLFGDIFNAYGGTTWDHLPYAASNGASISLWVQYQGTSGTGTYETDFTVQNSGGSILGGFSIHGDNSGVAAQINVDIYTPPFGALVGTIALGTVSLSTWYHVACTYDQPTSTAKAYLNGVLGGTSVIGTAWTSATNSGLNLENNDYFDTLIDELGWWSNTVLTPAQILLLYNSGAAQRPSNG